MGKTFFAALLLGLLLVGFWITQDVKAKDLTAESKSKENSDFKDWKDFSVPGVFKIRFPGDPQQAQEKLTDPKSKEKRGYNLYVATQQNGNAFMLNVITFPKERKEVNDESDLNNVLADMLQSNASNRVEKSELKTEKNRKSLSFTIVNNHITVDGQVFKDGDRLFVLSTVSQNQFHNRKEFEYFVNSFEFLGKP